MPAKIEGAAKLKNKLNQLSAKYGKKEESVTVGFTQRYALWVHEVQANHVVGQWKYLETPARRLKTTISSIIRASMQKGLTMMQSLMLGGLRLQREAQQITPVDTSALKASAFTCPTVDVEAVSAEHFAKSESIRLSEKATK